MPISLSTYSQAIQSAIQLLQISADSEISAEMSCKAMEEIKKSLLAVLPDLDSALLNEVVNHLVKEVGVKVPEDFKFIEYDDLPMLKPIQRRKYLDHLKREKTEHQPSTSAPRQDERQLNPTDTASPQGVCVFTNVSPNWAEDYEVPWTKLSKRDVLAKLEKGLRPSPKARREMIRIIAADIANITLNPGKKSLTCIAQKIVKRYPMSFKDDIEGLVVGSGFDSLLKQLICRFENINRNSNAAQQKCKRDGDGNENSEAGLTGKENPPPTLTDDDVESQFQKTPCLVVVGETLLMADRYMLAIDGIIVNNSIPNFTVGLLMMFASYYIFGICYPKDADATLEFIQRCFVGINPDKGRKAEKKKNRAHHTPVHPKVLGLINTFADLQWRG
ncbi:hypothetical protein Pmani_002565 [Petrolisthes manimaculis]|uniref:Uncharacterized protein n=1 Tax=Petrolisthes manimaculis TaxID=1843537 RepID=A0AAE1QK89_9EUCA|nr:hypothetical protein Pmani_002565 [Petrolisthes manimaculis]